MPISVATAPVTWYSVSVTTATLNLIVLWRPIPFFTAYRFSSNSIQVVSAAKPGNKRNTILTYVT